LRVPPGIFGQRLLSFHAAALGVEVVADQLQSTLMRQSAQPIEEPDAGPGRNIPAHLLLGVAKHLLDHIRGVKSGLKPGEGAQVPSHISAESFAVTLEQLINRLQASLVELCNKLMLLGVGAHLHLHIVKSAEK
jgi:hypothetical protein